MNASRRHLDAEKRRHVETHLDLARRIAASIGRRVPPTEREDLCSAAMLGLVEAAHRYDPAKQEHFAAFASKRIRGAVLDELRRRDPLARSRRSSARKLESAERSARARGCDDIAGSVYRATGMTRNEVDRLRAEVAAAQPCSVDVTELPAPTSSAFDELDLRRRAAATRRSLAELGERDRKVIVSLFVAEEKLSDVARDLGVSPARVCQLRTRAFAQMRSALSQQHGETLAA